MSSAILTQKYSPTVFFSCEMAASRTRSRGVAATSSAVDEDSITGGADVDLPADDAHHHGTASDVRNNFLSEAQSAHTSCTGYNSHNNERPSERECSSLRKRNRTTDSSPHVACRPRDDSKPGYDLCSLGHFFDKLGVMLQPRLIGRLGEIPSTWVIELHERQGKR